MKSHRQSETLNFSRVHIVEFGNHSGVATSVVLLFQGHVDTVLHMRFRYGRDWRSELGHFRGIPVVQAASRNRYWASLRFYGGLLVRLRKGDLLWISTGPEHSVVPDVLFLGVLLLLFPRSLVLTIRDANNWMTGYPRGFLSRACLRLRRMYLPFVQRLVFETRTQRQLFLDHHPQLSAQSASLPTMFSDGSSLWDFSEDPIDSVNTEHTLRLGLVGAVDPTRRDYSQLIRVIPRLALQLRGAVEIVVLGNSDGRGAEESLEALRKVAVVESAPGFLPQREFIRLSRTCRALLAPLMPGNSYGQTRGTGVFGDALVSGVKVITPNFVDPNREFADLSIAYDDDDSLLQILLELSRSRANAVISSEVLEEYRSAVLRVPLFAQLNLAFHEPSVV